MFGWSNRLAAAAAVFLLAGASLAEAQTVTRGPYLQMVGPDEITVRWRTDTATQSTVRFGTANGSYPDSETVSDTRTEHIVTLTGLGARATYFYTVGDDGGALAGQGDATFTFTTAPAVASGTPTRIWVIGDSGTKDGNARAVRNAYKDYAGSLGAKPADLWLMLGDNAYNDGTDTEYQAAVFDMYPEVLRRTPLFSTLGNHDGHQADSATQSGPYYDIFTFPTGGELGGLTSGTEAYYSFDYANIHFISLDCESACKTDPLWWVMSGKN